MNFINSRLKAALSLKIKNESYFYPILICLILQGGGHPFSPSSSLICGDAKEMGEGVNASLYFEVHCQNIADKKELIKHFSKCFRIVPLAYYLPKIQI